MTAPRPLSTTLGKVVRFAVPRARRYRSHRGVGLFGGLALAEGLNTLVVGCGR